MEGITIHGHVGRNIAVVENEVEQGYWQEVRSDVEEVFTGGKKPDVFTVMSVIRAIQKYSFQKIEGGTCFSCAYKNSGMRSPTSTMKR
jgi:hypothetical protein